MATPNAGALNQGSALPESIRHAGVQSDAQLQVLSERLEIVLQEVAQDLGLTLQIVAPDALAAIARQGRRVRQESTLWVVAPELARDSGGIRLRITVVPQGSKVQFVRAEPVLPEELEMRVVLMMRDLMEAVRQKPRVIPEVAPASDSRPATIPDSPGRVILALNSALLGAYVGYSLQQASGSRDDRLTYPMIALGAGIGLGGSMLVAEEWRIGVGDAWFLSAGTWWPTFSGLFLSESYGVSRSDRFAYGLLGATAGLTLSAGVLGFGHVSEGGAALVHSGGAFGTLLGALVELTIEGSTRVTPRRGMGYGAATGVVAAAALLAQGKPSAARVLLVDLAAGLGALTGAALGSPLLLVDENQSDLTRNRLFLASVAAGTVVGGLVGIWTTRPASPPGRTGLRLSPYLGVSEEGPDGLLPGASLLGTW